MELSPFPHHGPLLPDQVTGRDEAARQLALRLVEHRPTALLAPRRYGKTSLIGHTLHRLEEAGAASAVRVDLFGLASFADFAARLDRALANTHGLLRRTVDSVAAGLSVRLGVVQIDLRQKPGAAPDPVAMCHGLLDVLIGAAGRDPLVVAFDEFSDIARVGGLDALLRTHLQEHYQRLGLVFAGSSPSMMRELFAGRSRPFFAQAEIFELGPLDQPAVADIVHRGFAATARGAGPVAMRAWTMARGHPQRTMQLADAAWRRTPQGEEATDVAWEGAVADVRAAVDGGFRAVYEELGGAQGPVLRAIARTGSPFSAAEARFHDLSNSSITLARDQLVRDGHVVRQGATVRIVDPLWEDWLVRTFP
ncbi:MAG TPA: hypothetical protein VKU91_04920 [Acidimicrobiales bacterium]|nr:hypothetical protein [Acidimicrobiales bacterium]